MNARQPNGYILSKSGSRPYSTVIGALLSGLESDAIWIVVTAVCSAHSPQKGLGADDHVILVRIRLWRGFSELSACGFCCDARAAVRW